MTWPFGDDRAPPRSPETNSDGAGLPAARSESYPSEQRFGQATQFGHYRVLRSISKGGTSEVYEAIHVGLKKRVALKVMSPQRAQDPESRARFVAQAESTARVHHPNVIDVADIGVVDGLPYVVMTLLQGETLRALYARSEGLPFPQVVDLLAPIAAAVAVGHELGFVHGGLTPDKIFLHRELRHLRPKLLDFGISLELDAARAQHRARNFGSDYLAPEQARADRIIDGRTDQYALAVIVYEGLTGQLPRPRIEHEHDPPQRAELVRSPPAPGSVGPPRNLRAVIERATALEPRDRFASMRDFALALLPFASDEVRAYWSAELADKPGEIASSARAPDAAESPSAQSADQGRTDREQYVDAPEKRGNLRGCWPCAVVALIAATISWLVLQSARRPEPQPAASSMGAFEVDVAVTPASAELVLDERRVGVGHYAAQLAKDGAWHQLRVQADGFADELLTFRDCPPPSHISLRELPSRADERAARAPRQSPNAVQASEGRASRNALGRPDRQRRPPRSAALPPRAVGAIASPPPRPLEPVPAPPMTDGPEVPTAEPVPPAQVAGTELDPSRPAVRLIDERAPEVQVVP